MNNPLNLDAVLEQEILTQGSCDDYALQAPARVSVELLRPFEDNVLFTPKIYRVSNAYALGEFGIPVTEEGMILMDPLIQERNIDIKGSLISTWNHRSEVTALPGEYMMLYGLWSEGFWHWLMEYLPTIIMAEAAGYRGKYVVPQAPFIAESFQLLGIDLARVLAYVGGSFHVEQLVIPIRPAGAQLINLKALLMELRSKLIFGARASHASSARRLYISRAHVNRPRKVVNESDVVQAISQYKFESVALEKLSLTDQIGLTTQADVLMGPHGAGMLHCLFMKPESLVVEFFSPLYVNMTILPTLTHLKHRYHMISSYSFDGASPHGDDIHVCPELLNLVLRNELS